MTYRKRFDADTYHASIDTQRKLYAELGVHDPLDDPMPEPDAKQSGEALILALEGQGLLFDVVDTMGVWMAYWESAYAKREWGAIGALMLPAFACEPLRQHDIYTMEVLGGLGYEHGQAHLTSDFNGRRYYFTLLPPDDDKADIRLPVFSIMIESEGRRSWLVDKTHRAGVACTDFCQLCHALKQQDHWTRHREPLIQGGAA